MPRTRSRESWVPVPRLPQMEWLAIRPPLQFGDHRFDMIRSFGERYNPRTDPEGAVDPHMGVRRSDQAAAKRLGDDLRSGADAKGGGDLLETILDGVRSEERRVGRGWRYRCEG